MSELSPHGALVWGLVLMFVIGAAGCGNRGGESTPVADADAHAEHVSSVVLRVEGMT